MIPFIGPLRRAFLFLVAVLMLSCGGSSSAPEPQARARPTIGATLFYLDSPSQHFPWIIEHIERPEVRAEVEGVLDALSAHGVGAIRLLVAVDHFSGFGHGRIEGAREGGYPVAHEWQVSGLQRVIHLVRARGLKVEVIFVGRMNIPSFDFVSAADDATWIRSFLDRLDRSTIDLVLISGDTNPSGSRNNADYLLALWPMLRGAYPGTVVSYSVIGMGGATDFDLLRAQLQWVARHTPDVPVVAVALYPGPVASQREAQDVFARAIAEVARLGRPVWIDEFGSTVGDPALYAGAVAAACAAGAGAMAWVGATGFDGFGLLDAEARPTENLLAVARESCSN